MEIVLTPEIARLVEEKVASGEYPTPADVMQAALHLLDERDRVYRVPDDESIAIGKIITTRLAMEGQLDVLPHPGCILVMQRCATDQRHVLAIGQRE